MNNTNLFGEYVCEATNSLGTLKRTITLIEGTKPSAPPHITLRGVNSNTFDLDVGAQKPASGDVMAIHGYRFEIVSTEDHRNNGGKWMNARVVVKDFTDGNKLLFKRNDNRNNVLFLFCRYDLLNKQFTTKHHLLGACGIKESSWFERLDGTKRVSYTCQSCIWHTFRFFQIYINFVLPIKFPPVFCHLHCL